MPKFEVLGQLLASDSGTARRGGGVHRGHVPPPSLVGGPHKAGILKFFSAKFYKNATFYHICKMKWAKSKEKIEIGEGALSS